MWTLQDLINNGSIWSMEGSAGRGAMDAIESGQAILGKEGHRDYWGTYVPSRYEVHPDTKGSIDYANNRRVAFDHDPITEADFDAGLGFYGDDEEE